MDQQAVNKQIKQVHPTPHDQACSAGGVGVRGKENSLDPQGPQIRAGPRSGGSSLWKLDMLDTGWMGWWLCG